VNSACRGRPNGKAGIDRGQILLNFLITPEYFNFDATKTDEDNYNYQTISSFANN